MKPARLQLELSGPPNAMNTADKPKTVVPKQTEWVHKIKEGNKACIYISHDIQDVYEISDRFVIMDRGEIVSSIPKADITLKALDEFLLEYAHGMKDKDES